MSPALRSRVHLTHRWATEVPGRSRGNPPLAVAVDGTRARAYLLAGEARLYLEDPETTLRRFRDALHKAAGALDWARGPAGLTVVSRTRYATGHGWVLARASYDREGPGVTLTVSGDTDTSDIRIPTLEVALTTHSWLGDAARRVDSVLTELAEYGPCATGEKNTRWHVAVHEAGHVVVGRKLGGRGVGAVLTTESSFTGGPFDEAVYLLAGAAAGRLVTGDPALDGSNDLDAAQKVLAGPDRYRAGTGHTLRDAERRAATLARRHRQQIVDTAWRLYHTGRT